MSASDPVQATAGYDICPACHGCGWENPAEGTTRCQACGGQGGVPIQQTTGWRPISEAPPKARVMAWRPAWQNACEVWVDDFEPGRVIEPITGKTWIAEWWMPLVPPPPGQERRQ